MEYKDLETLRIKWAETKTDLFNLHSKLIKNLGDPDLRKKVEEVLKNFLNVTIKCMEVAAYLKDEAAFMAFKKSLMLWHAQIDPYNLNVKKISDKKIPVYNTN